MEAFNPQSIDPIINAANSPEVLNDYGINRVVSLTNSRQCPQLPQDRAIQQLHVDIEDNPFEDILVTLEGICAWIDNALASGSGVLVHCVQGISRSGAVIVAYLMRKHSISYEAALELARKSRPIITPNSGFADQLRLWHEMTYSIYDEEKESAGEKADRKLKTQYVQWKVNKGILLSKGDQAKQEGLRKSMADMAAQFGKRRLEMKESNFVDKK
ncbi:phosphatases II [Byssothecium circinans]|uniref:protein-tyrosine-phosphatase n=1 Tax=Byssothecium circinans TaxID=147558 RepID=A0A6A5U0N4_9PLEO|nr:phosphatases II [Byssothecium circinans]